MAIGHYPSLLVTGPRRIKNGGGYLLGYVFGSTGGAAVVSFRENSMTGTELWRDQAPATTGEAARYMFPSNGLRFNDALYVTGTDWPSKLFIIYQ